MPNRLAREKSPYLLQHAHNPVDWMPWGEEAFARARAEDKPLLVSIGYSTCHWCHVMERESFEDPATAELMNRHLVCVKVDREERPDVDRVYMNAVSALSGQGGWPLNAFLAPDGRPFYGGTYFPPRPAYGRPAWGQLVEAIGRAWKDAAQRPRMLEDAASLARALRGLEEGGEAPAALGPEALGEALAALRRSFDREQGGFALAPKFPMPVFQHLLLRLGARAAALGQAAEAAEAEAMALETLRRMARGGICDQLGGGFARYSTDERWLLPHFEKMLYDNALLALNYAEAWALAGEPAFEQALRGTLGYLLRDLRAPGGGFYSAEDADSAEVPGGPRREGAFYLWRKAEIVAALGEEAELFCAAYGVEEGGNLREDPHGEFEGLNVLLDRRGSLGALAASGERGEAERERALAECRRRLFELRARRPRPARDEKLLSSWNGLAIAALARAGALLGEESWTQAAREAAEFFLRELWQPEEGRLWRRWAAGERAVEGQAEDYAFLAWGLLELHQASLEERWLRAAQDLLKAARPRFYDEGDGRYWPGGRSGDALLPARLKETYDNVEPAAASVFAELQLRLWNLTGEAAWREDAERTLRAHLGAMRRNPRSLAFMLAALARALQPPAHALLLGRPGDPASRALLGELRRGLRPWLDLRALDPQAERAAWPEHARALAAGAGQPSVVLCRDFACSLPLAEPAALARALRGT